MHPYLIRINGDVQKPTCESFHSFQCVIYDKIVKFLFSNFVKITKGVHSLLSNNLNDFPGEIKADISSIQFGACSHNDSGSMHFSKYIFLYLYILYEELFLQIVSYIECT